jgi:hypothetical protein
MLRQIPGKSASPITIYVEQNLGFEAEHHKRALESLPGVTFYLDQKANRVGVLTTEAIKHAMCQLVVVMLQEHQIHMHKPLVSKDEKGLRLRLRERMEVYGNQHVPKGQNSPLWQSGWHEGRHLHLPARLLLHAAGGAEGRAAAGHAQRLVLP